MEMKETTLGILAELSLMPWHKGEASHSKGTDVWPSTEWSQARQPDTHPGKAPFWC